MGDSVRRFQDDTDNQLAALVKAGDSEAFVELTARYMILVRAKASPFHSTMLEADDLCQEGLMGLLDAARSYRPEEKASFRTYAGVCIGNRIIMAHRWASGRKNLPLNDFVPLNGEGEVPAREESNPEAMLVSREDLNRLKERIQKNLSKMENQVLLRYLSGWSYQEIAQALGTTQKAADNALQRARRKLKEPVLD